MRSPLFGKLKLSLRSSALVFLALFLSLSVLLNLAPSFLKPAYAKKCTSGENCYFVSLTSEDGKETIIGRNDNSGFTPTDGQLNVAVIYRITYDTNNNGRQTVDVSAPGWSSSQLNDATDNWADNAMVDIRIVDNGTNLFYVKRISYKQLESKYWKQNLNISNGDKKVLKTTGSSLFEPASVVADKDDGILQIISTGVGETNRETSLTETDIDSAETDETTTGTIGEDVTETYDSSTNADGSSSDSDDSDTISDVTCSKATAGLGWILCSLGELASTILKTLYEKFIMPALQIRPVLLDRDNGTYAVWATFRDIANILFVIYLLVVIMSQLTGIGIDNYGIKKSLPRLIVAAILVNVSYLICQLAVDVSNVIGASLYNFLANIEISGYQDFVDMLLEKAPGDPKSNFVTYLIAFVFLGGSIWMSGGFVAAAASAVIPILAALFGAAISVIFMFAMLSFRNAVVVIGVALSPLAFVCYILPSTKKIYDRWLAIMKGMIFLYPICSMVIGGGYLASRIILGSGGADSDVFLIISAIVAEVAPFFAVPSLVRAAYKATGELGARLNGMSLMASRRAQFNFRRSQMAQGIGNFARVRAANNISRRRFFTTRNSRVAARNTVLSAEHERRAADFMDNDANFESTRNANVARDNLAFEHKARDNAAMNDADNVRALSIQSRIADEAQLEKNRQYAAQVQNIGEATLQNATIQQAVINQEGQLQSLANYADATYQAGKRASNAISNESERDKTNLYADATYQAGKRASAALGVRSDRNSTGLLADGAYVRMRESQQDAAISNETTKMYIDQLSHEGRGEWLKALKEAARGTDSSGAAISNRNERLRATIQVMSSKGASDSIMEVLSGSEGTRLADAMKGQSADAAQLRNDVISALGSTGNVTLTNYSKHIGTAGASTVSFDKYMDNSKLDAQERTDLSALIARGDMKQKYMSMTDTMDAKGKNAFDGMDKDDIDNYFKNANAADISRLNSEAYMRALTTKTDEEIEKLNQGMAAKLYNKKKEDIRKKATGQFITDAKDESLDILRTEAVNGGFRQIDREIAFREPILQVKSDPRLLTQWSQQRQSQYHFSWIHPGQTP